MNNILPFLDDVNVPKATTTSESHTGQRHWKLKDVKFFYNQNVMNVSILETTNRLESQPRKATKLQRDESDQKRQGMSTNDSIKITITHNKVK